MDAKMATRLLEFTLYLGRPHTNVWERPSLESVSATPRGFPREDKHSWSGQESLLQR